MHARDSPLSNNIQYFSKKDYIEMKRRKGHCVTHKKNTFPTFGSGADVQRAAFFCFR